MPMYKLIEYSYTYSKTSDILRQYCRDVPAVNEDGAIIDFTKRMLLIRLILKKINRSN